MQIRTMTLADYPAVYALWLNTAGMGLNNLDDSLEGITIFLKRNPTTCFVAVPDATPNTPTPKVSGVIMSGHDGRRGYIYHLAVAEPERKQGIASKLLDASLEALVNEGIKKVALVVFSKNEGGNAFWQNQGFTPRTDLVYRNKALTEIERIDT